MVGQCHRSHQREFGPAPGGSRRQVGLACSGAWGHEESGTTKQLNNNNCDHAFGLSEFGESFPFVLVQPGGGQCSGLV